ncbi:hypothetical protein M3Y97_00004300 [Aphelenchoides bicaudatus]|nr:hypothetical protein M3Y97_00004300 [Aphelenchoides bicaudatus]
MSVDKTIEELSGTLAQLGILVEHINTQIIGITSRINMTLDNFDHSVAGIASDAGLMTGQVPNAWVFYLLFITLIIVLILLSTLIIINLVTRAHAIYRIVRGDSPASRPDSPVPSVVYSDSKQPLNLSHYPTSPPVRERFRHTALQMDSEPRRYGLQDPMGTFNGSQDPGGGVGTATHGTYYPPSRSTEVRRSHRSHRYSAPKKRTLKVKSKALDQLSTSFIHYRPVCTEEPKKSFNNFNNINNFNKIPEKSSDDDDKMPPQIETDGMRRIVSMLVLGSTFARFKLRFRQSPTSRRLIRRLRLESNNPNEAYLRRQLNPKDQFDQRSTTVDVQPPQRAPPPRYQQQKPLLPSYRNGPIATNTSTTFTKREAEPV